MLKQKIKSLPKEPGVYLFKDKFSNILYIGKAKNLKNRVSSYFSNKNKFSAKTMILVKNIDDFEYIIVDNEIESLLLENKLIKKHKPKYNINLKDSKTFAYIKITNEKIPKIVSTRILKDDGTYFGPYVDSNVKNEIINLVVEIFNILTPKTYSSKSKLNYEIGLAPAESEKKINLDKYYKQVDDAKEFLKGNDSKILNRLKNEMRECSNAQKYEIAAQKKRQIDSIEYLKEKQKVDLIKSYDQDVLALVIDEAKSRAIIEMFNINKGVISGRKTYKFEYDEEVFESFIKMYYSQNSIPKEIVVNFEFWQNDNEKKILEQYLLKIKGNKVIINYPKKGEKVDLIKLAEKNAKENIEEIKVLIEMKEKIGLRNIPHIIECFDISNLGREHLVGAMTRFVDLKEDKSNYRKFEIKSFKEKNDDYLSIKEVIYRRYLSLRENNLEMPDLIIIDGGKGQLSSAIESLDKLELKISIIGLAKKEEEIFLQNKTESLKFDKNSSMMLYIRKIRDTTHRFVLSYNKKKRDMKFRKDINK